MTGQPRVSSSFLADSRGVFSHIMNDKIDKIAYLIGEATLLALRFFQCRDSRHWKNHSANEVCPVNLWDMGKIDN